jgi:hypothetical protein
MMYAILGRNPEGKSSPEIDSRLNTVHCETVDISDECDKEILGQTVMQLVVNDAKSLAVLLYRLEELYTWVDDEELVEAADGLFRDLIVILLGCDNDEPWLFEYPLMESCPNCGQDVDGSKCEVQDQLYVCTVCGWVGDYQTEWPYLHAGYKCLGRLDTWVAKRLESSDDDTELQAC